MLESIVIPVESAKGTRIPFIRGSKLPSPLTDLSYYELAVKKNYDNERTIQLTFQQYSGIMDKMVVIALATATLDFYGELFQFAGIRSDIEYGYYDDKDAVVIFEYVAV